ncbi:hypothetical protein [Agathobacter ruminis]|uniref:Uncharacterized protein n=1 Tax=Agathobacter ruminis TaxID=1712665 RepID=A0A2G3E4A1_9FIRM|nr:hypothetical protein [Agathobacter ruminis]MDC7302256.1 hypothetical protein [Agathobacter ruminis]PHU37903.1 hypothetical protein CSX02_05530 [Agathobacter ruminis]
MWNYIKIEMRRAFQSKGMLYGLLAACSISIIQIIIDVLPMLEFLQPISEITSKKDIMFPHTVFQHALPFNASSAISLYYYMIIPIFSAIPFATTLYRDQKNGYTKNVFTRTAKNNYYIAQYFSAFVSAGVVAVVPQILNVLIVAIILPSTKPYAGIGYVGIFSDCMFSVVYYKNPYIYLFIFLVIDFIVFGLLNTMALSLSSYMRSEFAVLMIPFLILQFIDFATECIEASNYSILGITMPMQPYINVSFKTVMIYCLVMVIIDVIAMRRQDMRKDWYE